jgi:hypothetical protein
VPYDSLRYYAARLQPFDLGKEVKKMVESYGATFPDDDQGKIVEYLVAVRGAPDSK